MLLLHELVVTQLPDAFVMHRHVPYVFYGSFTLQVKDLLFEVVRCLRLKRITGFSAVLPSGPRSGNNRLSMC